MKLKLQVASFVEL